MAGTQVVQMKYCSKCGNTGIDINGEPCTCKFRAESVYATVSCMIVPDQYRGLVYSEYLVRTDISEGYPGYITSIYNKVISGKFNTHNLCICSPIASSKSVLAYTCITEMFRRGLDVFPLFDVLEIKRFILDVDLCRKPFYEVDNPNAFITTPVLFVKVPRVTTLEVFDTMLVILDRRVRRGKSTIFIYDGTWEQLVRNDKQGLLSGIVGDGSYSTLEVKSWFLNFKEPTALVETNIG